MADVIAKWLMELDLHSGGDPALNGVVTPDAEPLTTVLSVGSVEQQN